MSLLWCPVLLVGVGRLPSPILIRLLGALPLPLTLALPLSSRRWRKWAVPNLMLRASTTKAPLHQVAFSSVVTQFPISVARYLWLCIRMLASPINTVRVLILGRPTIFLLQLEVASVIPLPLGSQLLIEIVTPLFHRPLYIDCSVV